MWTPLYTGHFGLVPKVSAFRGSTVIRRVMVVQMHMSKKKKEEQPCIYIVSKIAIHSCGCVEQDYIYYYRPLNSEVWDQN